MEKYETFLFKINIYFSDVVMFMIDQKHYVSRRVWPWPRYPNYLMGGCYAIAGQAVKSLLAATQTTPFFWIEDIYLTGLCASKVNVSLQSHPK